MLLDTLDDADLAIPTENGLSVRDLVTHVALVDEAFVASANDESVFIDAASVETITGGRAAGDGGLVVRADPRATLRRARAALVELDSRYPADARVGGYSLRRRS